MSGRAEQTPPEAADMADDGAESVDARRMSVWARE